MKFTPEYLGTSTPDITLSGDDGANLDVSAGGKLGTAAFADISEIAGAGDFVSSLVGSGSAVTLTTNTAASVTNILLTAGDWDVQGIINFAGSSISGTGTVSYTLSGTNNVSATMGSFDTFLDWETPFSTTSNFTNGFIIPAYRYNLDRATTIYLVAKSGFTNMTLKAFGSIRARKMK
jgi:hypothetical protein